MKEKIKITVMCDYSSNGIYWNDIHSDIDELPKSTHFLKEDLNLWQAKYESFHLYNMEDTDVKYFQTLHRFKDFLEEGKEIAMKLRGKLNYSKYDVEYFNEASEKREKII